MVGLLNACLCPWFLSVVALPGLLFCLCKTRITHQGRGFILMAYGLVLLGLHCCVQLSSSGLMRVPGLVLPYHEGIMREGRRTSRQVLACSPSSTAMHLHPFSPCHASTNEGSLIRTLQS